MSALKRGAFVLMVFLVMLPASGTAAPTDDDVTDEWLGDVEDLPDTAAPIVERDAYPMDRYALDVYEPEDDEGWMDAIASAFSLSDQASEAWHFIVYQLLSGVWYVYRTVASAIIFLVDQVFTFDIVGSISSHVGTMIGEVGGQHGLGQFVTLTVIFTTFWLVYQLAYRRYRLTIVGLVTAALISAGFSLFVSNADDLIDTANDYRNLAANALLNTTTFVVDDEVSSENAAEMEPVETTDEDEEITRDSYTEEFTTEYGMSRIGNLLHDLFVVKPYMLLQFGTTNVATIGGGDPDASGDELENAVQEGENQIRDILDQEPGSDEREEVVQDAAANNAEIYGPEDNWERLGNAFLVWLPLLSITPFVAYVAIMVQVYNVGFLFVAATGVVVLIVAIFPAFRNFAMQWGFKLLYFLFMTVAMIFAAVFMFALIMIIYRVGGEEQWSYFTMVVAIAICMFAMVFLQRQIWGYKRLRTMARHPVQSATNSMNMQFQEYRQQKQAQQAMDRGSNPTGWSPSPGHQGGVTSGGHNLEVMKASMDRKSQQDPSPIKQNPHKRQKPGASPSEGSPAKGSGEREGTGMQQEQASMQRKSRDNVAPITQKHRDQQQPKQKETAATSDPSKASKRGSPSTKPASNTQTAVQRQLEEMRRKSKDPNGVVKGQPAPPKAKANQTKPDAKDAKKARNEQERIRKKNQKGPKKGE